LDAESLDQAVEAEIQAEAGTAPLKVRILTAEHLVATALKVGRAKDRERILRFVEDKAIDWNRLKGVLERHHLFENWHKFRAQTGLPDFE
jgi:hypothetical protein